MMQVSTCWTDPVDLQTTLSILGKVASRYALLGGRVGLEINELITAQDYRALCDYEIDYAPFWNEIQLANCRQALAFFQKLEPLPIGVDKKEVARVKFEEAEVRCRETNVFIHKFLNGNVNLLPADALILYKAQRFIESVLGHAPNIDELNLSFGPGATTSVKKSNSCPTEKLAEQFCCSSKLIASGLLPSLIRSVPHWGDTQQGTHYSVDDEGWLVQRFDVKVGGGRLEFVPKSAKTYRCIDKQPTINSLFQAGLGKYLSRRLKLAGLDLSSNLLNQQFAKSGSIDGLTATIDLSNASDTISRELVKFLLPDCWYSLLDAARCSTTTFRPIADEFAVGVKEEVVYLQKFSSMGNGFTFPLESLIFWALTLASVPVEQKHLVTVYGDDIICPSESYARVVRTLEVCGFEVNLSKSFSTGHFRESCGVDYYLGTNIRPFYQKHLISGQTLFTLHNFLYRRFDFEMAEIVKSLIPKPLRLYGPDGYGDGHLLSSKWPAKRVKDCARLGWGGSFFETYAKVGKAVISRYPGDFVSPLYSIYTRGREPLSPHISEELCEGSAIRFARDGRPLWPVPASTDEYKKVLVYTYAHI
jgi:hypothetical protein